MGQLKARVIVVDGVPEMVVVGSEKHAAKLLFVAFDSDPEKFVTSFKVPIDCQGCHKMKSFLRSFDRKVKSEAAKRNHEHDANLDRRAAKLANRMMDKVQGAGVKVRHRAVSRRAFNHD